MTHAKRTGIGRRASSHLNGARNRYPLQIAIVCRAKTNGEDIMRNGTPQQIKLIATELSETLPDEGERALMKHLAAHIDAYRKFRERDEPFVEREVSANPSGGIRICNTGEGLLLRLYCESCGKEITDAAKGAIVFSNTLERGQTSAAMFVHKGGKCHRSAENKIALSGWLTLQVQMEYLVADLG